MDADALPTPLIDAATLAARLDDVVLLDARRSRAAYEEEHLRGAFFADLESDLSGDSTHPEEGGRHPLPPFEAWCTTVGRWGIGPQTPVVVMDDSGGMLSAARVWWMLRSMGHGSVAVLDGGIAAAAALPRATGPAPPPGGPAYPAKTWRWPRASAEEVERARHDPSRRIVDVRSAERFAGRSEPLDPTPGHIAGAMSLPCRDNLNAEGRFRSPESLAVTFATLGVPAEKVVVSCGSGVTACHTLLAMEHAGFRGAALYVGSYSEWVRQKRPTGPL